MTPASHGRLYFFWDYDISDEELRRILAGDNTAEIRWAMTRLLEAARWDDIWKYVTLRRVREWFPRLQLRPETRAVWSHALQIWGEMDATQHDLDPTPA
jgi:hypothetical protein